MKKIMLSILNFFKTNFLEFSLKKVSFYLSLIASILALVAAIVFASPAITKATDLRGYFDQSNNINMILAIVSIAVIILFSLYKKIFLYGKIISWALVFTNFLLYVKTIYMYFAGVFYNGITADAIKSIDPGCLVSILLLLVGSIIGNVAIYLDNKKKETEYEVKEN